MCMFVEIECILVKQSGSLIADPTARLIKFSIFNQSKTNIKNISNEIKTPCKERRILCIILSIINAVWSRET